MNLLKKLMDNATQMGGGTLILVPNTEPRIRTLDGWVPVLDSRWDAGMVKEVLWSVLTEPQRTELSEFGQVMGSLCLADGKNISIHAYKHKLGFAGTIREIQFGVNEMAKTQISPVLFEQIIKSSGLFIISGPSGSGKSTTLAHLVEKVNLEKASNIVLFETTVTSIHRPKKSIITQLEKGLRPLESKDWMNFQEADVVGIEVELSTEVLQGALSLCESGKTVILTVMIDSLHSLINKISIEAEGNQRLFLLDRLASQLRVFINQRLMKGLSSDLILAQEIILFNESLRSTLKKGDLINLFKLVSETGEKVGMKTLNQSLLQLSVRRKIDLKTAYNSTPFPEELDELFTRMGV
jgi:twitching motility protein PilT